MMGLENLPHAAGTDFGQQYVVANREPVGAAGE